MMAALLAKQADRFRPPSLRCLLCARLSWSRSMGGGPRTFPGGVNKWQWKRMQEKHHKAKLKRRLAREKEVYTFRQRAQVLAEHPELMQPWEKLATFPSDNVTPEQHIQSLVGRFNKLGAEDIWTEDDGPQLSPKQPAAAPPEMEAPKDPSILDDAIASILNKKDELPKKVRKIKLSPKERSLQDYRASFDSDPLGVSVEGRPSSNRKQG